MHPLRSLLIDLLALLGREFWQRHQRWIKLFRRWLAHVLHHVAHARHSGASASGRTNASRRTQNFPGGAYAEVVSSKSLGKAVLITHGMANAPAGKVYQAWFQHGQSFSSAGIMPTGPDRTLLLDGDASTASAVGITVEPEGGSSSPTSAPLALITIV